MSTSKAAFSPDQAAAVTSIAQAGDGLWLMGMMRPLVGVFLGLFMLTVLQSRLFPFDLPGGAQGSFVYVALSFIAGFRERLSLGVITAGERRLLAEGKPAPSVPPQGASRIPDIDRVGTPGDRG